MGDAARPPQVRHTASVSSYRVAEAAEVLGVSNDTVRRWIDAERVPARAGADGRTRIEGADLAALAKQIADHGADAIGQATRAAEVSARNRLRGIVTAVKKDTVMAQVEIQAGPFRLVSLMSREAADQLGLDVGSVAVAVVKSTNVVVELP